MTDFHTRVDAKIEQATGNMKVEYSALKKAYGLELCDLLHTYAEESRKMHRGHESGDGVCTKAHNKALNTLMMHLVSNGYMCPAE